MKFFTKFLVVVLFTFFVLYHTTVAKASGLSVPILMYHYVRDYSYKNDPNGITLSVSPYNFDAQMAYLKQNGYTAISLDTLYAIFNLQSPAPAKPVVITFDDGYIDLYTNAYPILRKYGFSAVSFVITGFVNKPGFLSWDNIREMRSSGLMTFESQTVSHAILPSLNYSSMVSELKNSKETLQAHTGYSVNFIAYPSGAVSASVMQAARNLGYAGGLGTWFGKAYYPSMNMPRIRVNGQFTLNLFASRL